MYYVMRTDRDDAGVMIMPQPIIPGQENVLFDVGARLEIDIPVFDFVMDEECQGELLDYVWTNLRGITISSKFKSVLESVGIDNVDYYPVRIVNEVTGETSSDYFVANIVGIIPCMDMKNSKYKNILAFPDKIRSIQELHIDYSKIDGDKLFRLAELKTAIIIAHESLKIAAEEAKLSGVTFSPAEGYSM